MKMFEKLLFAVLLVASLAGFSVRFLPILRKILTAKPDADFSLHPIGNRVRDFVWEVMLQAKAGGVYELGPNLAR